MKWFTVFHNCSPRVHDEECLWLYERQQEEGDQRVIIMGHWGRGVYRSLSAVPESLIHRCTISNISNLPLYLKSTSFVGQPCGPRVPLGAYKEIKARISWRSMLCIIHKATYSLQDLAVKLFCDVFPSLNDVTVFTVQQTWEENGKTGSELSIQVQIYSCIAQMYWASLFQWLVIQLNKWWTKMSSISILIDIVLKGNLV